MNKKRIQSVGPCTRIDAGADVYIPTPDEAEAALADAALMNENMRLYGCIDKPKDVGVPYTCIDELQQF